jgi:hypothetical protein
MACMPMLVALDVIHNGKLMATTNVSQTLQKEQQAKSQFWASESFWPWRKALQAYYVETPHPELQTE